ncbi:MAG: GNAT family N-acetyltransferase [Acidobacteria bacterium]|nr:GNAT family N-acetyltransferase [Acidobacteriota bacterium]
MQQDNSFVILHDYPDHDVEQAWRGCLARVRIPYSYCAPEFFLEPLWAGKRPFAILSVDHAGKVLGVLTGLHEGRQVVCGNPFRSQVCIDKTANLTEVSRCLATGLLVEGRSAELASVFAWHWDSLDGFKDCGFRYRQTQGCVVLDLTLGPEALFSQFDENRRRNIRHAIRNKVEVRPASSVDDIREFHRVYLAWRQTPRKRILGQEIPLAMWEGLFRLTSNRRFLLASHEGKVIASISLRFYAGGLLEFSSGCALEEYLYLRPHDLLQWRAIEWGCREGFLRYSLGGADEFHKRFGGTLVGMDRYRLDRSLLRHHDLTQFGIDLAAAALRKMPRPFEDSVRRFFGRV